MSEVNEYNAWFAAWGDTIAADPSRACHCGGTFSRHRVTCPYAPPYGYDATGAPHTESQLKKVMYELGRKVAERRNEAFMKALEATKPLEYPTFRQRKTSVDFGTQSANIQE